MNYQHDNDGLIKTTFDGIPILTLPLEQVVYIREQFRSIGEYAIADALRDFLLRNGITIKDNQSVSYN